MDIIIPNREEFCKGCEEFERHEKRDAMYKVATFLVDHFWGRPPDMANGLGVLLLTWNQAFYRYGIFDFDELEKCITINMQKIESFRGRNITSLSNSDEETTAGIFNSFLEALQIDVISFSDKNTGKYTEGNLRRILNRLGIEFEGDNLKTLYDSLKNSKIGQAVEFVADSQKDSIEIRISGLGPEEREKLYSLDKQMKIVKRSPVSVSKALHLLAPNFFPLWDDKIARHYGCYYDVDPAIKYIFFSKTMKTLADRVQGYTNRPDRTVLKLIDEYNYSKYTQGWI
jgi:uncharacterized protein YwbE